MSLTLPSPGSVSGIIRHLRHIQPTPKGPGGKFANKSNTFAKHMPKFVQPKDRIAFWNIAPGDEVLVTVGGRKVIDEATGKGKKVPYEGIVGSVDRERNLVWLRAEADSKDDSHIPRNIKHLLPRLKDPEKGVEGGFSPNTAYVVRPVHYSNLKLKLPADLNLPKDVEKELDLKAGVYASRIANTMPSYDRRAGYFSWKRFAVVQSPKGGVLKIEVPWKTIDSREKLRRINHAMLKTVDSETWIPWNPSDPFRILSGKSWTSPQALERFLRSQIQSQKDQKVHNNKSKITEQGEISDREGTYAGFATRGVKPPLLPQAPTPAEQIWQARTDRSEWLNSAPVRQRLQKGGKTFAAIDYLNITPKEGPLSSQWRSLPLVLEGEVKRQDSTGEFESDGVSKREVDSWPIELLMEKDLTNPMGLRNRMRRWNRKQVDLKAAKAMHDMEEKANVEALKHLKL